MGVDWAEAARHLGSNGIEGMVNALYLLQNSSSGVTLGFGLDLGQQDPVEVKKVLNDTIGIWRGGIPVDNSYRVSMTYEIGVLCSSVFRQSNMNMDAANVNRKLGTELTAHFGKPEHPITSQLIQFSKQPGSSRDTFYIQNDLNLAFFNYSLLCQSFLEKKYASFSSMADSKTRIANLTNKFAQAVMISLIWHKGPNNSGLGGLLNIFEANPVDLDAAAKQIKIIIVGSAGTENERTRNEIKYLKDNFNFGFSMTFPTQKPGITTEQITDLFKKYNLKSYRNSAGSTPFADYELNGYKVTEAGVRHLQPVNFSNVSNPQSIYVKIEMRTGFKIVTIDGREVPQEVWTSLGTERLNSFFKNITIEDNGGCKTLNLTLLDKEFTNLEGIIERAVISSQLDMANPGSVKFYNNMTAEEKAKREGQGETISQNSARSDSLTIEAQTLQNKINKIKENPVAFYVDETKEFHPDEVIKCFVRIYGIFKIMDGSKVAFPVNYIKILSEFRNPNSYGEYHQYYQSASNQVEKESRKETLIADFSIFFGLYNKILETFRNMIISQANQIGNIDGNNLRSWIAVENERFCVERQILVAPAFDGGNVKFNAIYGGESGFKGLVSYNGNDFYNLLVKYLIDNYLVETRTLNSINDDYKDSIREKLKNSVDSYRDKLNDYYSGINEKLSKIGKINSTAYFTLSPDDNSVKVFTKENASVIYFKNTTNGTGDVIANFSITSGDGYYAGGATPYLNIDKNIFDGLVSFSMSDEAELKDHFGVFFGDLRDKIRSISGDASSSLIDMKKLDEKIVLALARLDNSNTELFKSRSLDEFNLLLNQASNNYYIEKKSFDARRSSGHAQVAVFNAFRYYTEINTEYGKGVTNSANSSAAREAIDFGLSKAIIKSLLSASEQSGVIQEIEGITYLSPKESVINALAKAVNKITETTRIIATTGLNDFASATRDASSAFLAQQQALQKAIYDIVTDLSKEQYLTLVEGGNKATANLRISIGYADYNPTIASSVGSGANAETRINDKYLKKYMEEVVGSTGSDARWNEYQGTDYSYKNMVPNSAGIVESTLGGNMTSADNSFSNIVNHINQTTIRSPVFNFYINGLETTITNSGLSFNIKAFSLERQQLSNFKLVQKFMTLQGTPSEMLASLMKTFNEDMKTGSGALENGVVRSNDNNADGKGDAPIRLLFDQRVGAGEEKIGEFWQTKFIEALTLYDGPKRTNSETGKIESTKVNISMGSENSLGRSDLYKSLTSFFNEFCVQCPQLPLVSAPSGAINVGGRIFNDGTPIYEDSDLELFSTEETIQDSNDNSQTIRVERNIERRPLTWMAKEVKESGKSVIYVIFYYKCPQRFKFIRDYDWGNISPSIVKNVSIKNASEMSTLGSFSYINKNWRTGSMEKTALSIQNRTAHENEAANTPGYESFKPALSNFVNDSRSNEGKFENIVKEMYQKSVYTGELEVIGDPSMFFNEVMKPFCYPINVNIYTPGYTEKRSKVLKMNGNEEPEEVEVVEYSPGGVKKSYSSGVYLVKNITHTITDSGYSTTLGITKYPGLEERILQQRNAGAINTGAEGQEARALRIQGIIAELNQASGFYDTFLNAESNVYSAEKKEVIFVLKFYSRSELNGISVQTQENGGFGSMLGNIDEVWGEVIGSYLSQNNFRVFISNKRRIASTNYQKLMELGNLSETDFILKSIKEGATNPSDRDVFKVIEQTAASIVTYEQKNSIGIGVTETEIYVNSVYADAHFWRVVGS
jgi:hypothetical protein